MSESLQLYPWKQFKRFGLFIGLLLACLLVLCIVYRFVFLSIAVSLFLTYIFYPAINWMESRVKIRRPILVLLLVGFLLGLIAALASVFLPLLYQELIGIIKKTPEAILYLQSLIEPIQSWFVSRGYISEDAFHLHFGNFNLYQEFSRTTQNALMQVWSTTPLVLGGALNLFLVPLFSWFFLSYGKALTGFVFELIPPDLQSLARLNFSKMNEILWSVIKGQVVVAFILALLYMTGFSIIGLQSGVAIGLLAGVCRMVPYLDVIVGLLLSIIVLVSQGGTISLLLAVLVVIACVQAIDGMLITPRVIGERAGIHPVIVIASVISFGDWFGILGVIIAVPMVAMTSAALQIALPYYKNSPYYRAE